jgi:hypothetical protein
MPDIYPNRVKPAVNRLESPESPIPHLEKPQVKNSGITKFAAAVLGGTVIGAVSARAYDEAILRAAVGRR